MVSNPKWGGGAYECNGLDGAVLRGDEQGEQGEQTEMEDECHKHGDSVRDSTGGGEVDEGR